MAGEITWKNISAPSFTGAAYLNKLGNDQTNKALGGISKWMGDRVQGGIDNNTNPLLDSIGSVNSLQDLSAMESQMSPEALTGQFGKYVDKGAISSALSKQKGILADKAGANLLSQVNSQIAAGGDSRTIRDNASGMIAKLGNNLTMEQASNLTNTVNGRTASGNKLTAEEQRKLSKADKLEERNYNNKRAMQLSIADLDYNEAMRESNETLASHQNTMKMLNPYFGNEAFKANGITHSAAALYPDIVDGTSFGKDSTFEEERASLNEGIEDLYKTMTKDGKPTISRETLEVLGYNVGKEMGVDKQLTGFWGGKSTTPAQIIGRMKDVLGGYGQYKVAKQGTINAKKDIKDAEYKFGKVKARVFSQNQ